MKDQKDILKRIKELARKQRLQRENEVGKTRSKSWGGKGTNKKDRSNAKKDIKKEYL